jgi:Aerotolerance regulator N-terminal
MNVLNPIWLWALSALAIPIAIHLLSRKEGRTIKLGSIRFLSETTTSKFSSIRLNEIALLTIRSLLVILLVVFLAGLIMPVISSDKSTLWVLVEKGLEKQDPIKTLTDSLQKSGYEIRRLGEGFPEIEADTSQQTTDYYRLAEELSAIQRDQTIIIASNSATHFKGKRIALPENVTWLSYPFPEFKPSASALRVDTLKVTLAFDKAFEYDRKIMRAAIQSIQLSTNIPIVIQEIAANDDQQIVTDWLIWLSDTRLTHAGRSLQYHPEPFGNLIVQKDKNRWLLTARLDEENAVEYHLTIQMMQMLFNDEPSLRNHEIVSLPDNLIWSKRNESKSAAVIERGEPADKVLILIIALLFISERILAFYRKQ